MGDIMDFIFSNFIIVLLVIGGIVKLLGNDNKEKRNEQTNNPRQPVESTQHHQRKTSERSNQPWSTSNEKTASQRTGVAIEERQQKQLERLAGKVATGQVNDLDDIALKTYDQDSHKAFANSQQHKGKDFKKEKQEVKQQLDKKISRSGLINSVIMAEVLGPPRARKPYKSVITERNQ